MGNFMGNNPKNSATHEFKPSNIKVKQKDKLSILRRRTGGPKTMFKYLIFTKVGDFDPLEIYYPLDILRRL
jgi:hypothetical protein